MGVDNLYDWLFHYNHYEELWSAFRREDKEKYFNGELKSNQFHRAKNVDTLIEFIAKSKTN